MENTEENIEAEINTDWNPIVEQEPVDQGSNQEIEIDTAAAQPLEQEDQAPEADDRSPEKNALQEGDEDGINEVADAN